MSPEASLRFPCFGGSVAVHVGDTRGAAEAEPVLQRVQERLLAMHARLSRFLPGSELSQINRSPLNGVAASPLLCRFASTALSAARRSGGLVDATQLGPLEQAGYRTSLEGAEPLELKTALRLAPPRRAASPDPESTWREIEVDADAGTIRRPPGVRLDSGGIAKGLAADLVAAGLEGHPTYAVDCAGDIRIGGTAGVPRQVQIDDPFGGAPLHELGIGAGAVATSGIGRRAWLGARGQPAHHLLDPATGKPAFTGVVQVTAIAPTATLAETLAKTALLRGPQHAAEELPFGGFVVFDDRSSELVTGKSLEAALVKAPERQEVAG